MTSYKTSSVAITSLFNYNLTIFFQNVKTQIDPVVDVTNDEEEKFVRTGVSGDVAALLISKLSSGKFSEIDGIGNSSLPDTFLSVNHYTAEERKQLEEARVNIIDNVGGKFYIKGNYIDYDTSYQISNMNVHMVLLYTLFNLSFFMERQLGEIENFEKELTKKLEDIKKSIQNYISGFNYIVTKDDKYTYSVELVEMINKPITKLKIFCNYK